MPFRGKGKWVRGSWVAPSCLLSPVPLSRAVGKGGSWCARAVGLLLALVGGVVALRHLLYQWLMLQLLEAGEDPRWGPFLRKVSPSR